MKAKENEYLFQLVTDVENRQTVSFRRTVVISSIIVALTLVMIGLSFNFFNEQKAVIASKETEKISMQEQLAAYEQTESAHKKQIEEERNRASDLAGKIESLEALEARLNNALSAKEMMLAGLETRKSELENQVDQQNFTIAGLQTKNSEYANIIDARDSTIASVEKKNLQLDDRVTKQLLTMQALEKEKIANYVHRFNQQLLKKNSLSKAPITDESRVLMSGFYKNPGEYEIYPGYQDGFAFGYTEKYPDSVSLAFSFPSAYFSEWLLHLQDSTILPLDSLQIREFPFNKDW